jgi:CheY-like chemotaxis protein
MADRTLADCHILVVEDEYMLADDLRDELESAGAIVLGPASDVASALALLAAEPQIDGAILDINLAGQTSFAVADELLRREVPFLFTTGYDRHAIPDRYQHLPRCEKPIRTAFIRDAIGRVIHG